MIVRNEVDIGIAAFYVTEARAQIVDLSVIFDLAEYEIDFVVQQFYSILPCSNSLLSYLLSVSFLLSQLFASFFFLSYSLALFSCKSKSKHYQSRVFQLLSIERFQSIFLSLLLIALCACFVVAPALSLPICLLLIFYFFLFLSLSLYFFHLHLFFTFFVSSSFSNFYHLCCFKIIYLFLETSFLSTFLKYQ